MSDDTDSVDEGDLESAEDEEESKPEIDTGATVDVDLDAVNEDLEADDEEAGTADDEEAPSSAESGATSAVMGEGDTMGDMYIKGLCSVSNAVIERHGGDPINESVARDLGLDSAMDEWIKSKGGSEDLPPGQALAVGTTMFAMAVLATNPTVVNALLEVLE